jgi:hypothetical protein
MHDVISDILASPKVPRDKKREEILKAGRAYRDNTSFVMSEADWLTMARQMGVNNMGGIAVGFLSPLPVGTVARGAVVAGMQHDNMAGMQHAPQQRMHPMEKMKDGAAMQPAPADSGMSGMVHQPTAHPRTQPTACAAIASDSMPGMQHSGMQGHDMAGNAGCAKDAAAMKEMHELMMTDPVIHARIMAVPRLREMMATTKTVRPKPARSATKVPAKKAAAVRTNKPAPRTAPKKTPAKPAPAGHDMGKMKM